MASDGTVWGVNSAASIYKYGGASAGWQQVPGALKTVSVGSATNIWGVNTAGDIYKYVGGSTGWEKIPGVLSDISVASDGTVWGVNSAGDIYNYGGGAAGWQQVPGALKTVAVGSATNVWGVNSTGDIYEYLREYFFALDWFRINNTRSGNIWSTAKDTDYVGVSLTTENGTKTLVKSVGNLTNGTYSVDLMFGGVEVPDDHKVIFAYHIINSSVGETSATAYLQQTLGTLTNAAAKAAATAAAEDIGAAIGAALGTAIPVPLIGSALGALAGWLVGDAWGIAFPFCDGPVATGVHIYTGAELRRMMLEELGGAGEQYGSLENNPGVNSPDGCGSNSNYDVYWTVSLFA